MTIPSQTEVEKLKLAPDEQVLRMERVRYGNDVPICYEIATVPANLVQKFSKEEITTSFYRTLEKRRTFILVMQPSIFQQRRRRKRLLITCRLSVEMLSCE